MRRSSPVCEAFCEVGESLKESMNPRATVKTITVITPCFNAGKYIRETIESVLNQSAIKEGRLRLNYWVIDGGSSDDTTRILDEYAGRGVKYISERDAGMYDALAKGFEKVDGEVCCYINAGDYYHPQAFDVVKEVFDGSDVQWLTGYSVMYNERSQVINFYLHKRYFRRFIRRGIYGRFQPHIQQESTFWRSELLDLVDMSSFRKLRYAGDFMLWHGFASRHELFVVASQLGGFKVHAGQLSSAMDKYMSELESVSAHRATLVDRCLSAFDKLVAKLPSRALLVPLGYDRVIRWDRDRDVWQLPN